MTTTTFILLCVGINSAAQIILKIGANQAALSLAGQTATSLWSGIQSYLNPYVIGGLSLYILGAALWIRALSLTSLNYITTFTGLSMAITIAMSRLLLGEQLPWLRVAGMAAILMGILAVAKS